MKRQLLTVMAIVLTAVVSMGQVLNIGGHRTPMDTLNSFWLCCIPQSLFGNDYTAQVTFGDEISELTIDSTAVASGEEFTFEGIEGGKQYIVTAQMGDSLYTGYITFTWLPIVEIFDTTAISKVYSYATIYVNEPDSALAMPMSAKIKTRGIATNQGGKHKRNYRIKFINDEDSTKMNRRFFGLRNDNSWILDAGQMDFLRVRNRVSTDLWLDMARRPWYSDTLPNARNGSRGEMVEVMLNGEYRGIYNMCEPIDRKQLKLKRYDTENEEFHGMLWATYTRTRTVMMSEPARLYTWKTTWDGFEAKYPDYDEIGALNWDVLANAVYFVNREDNAPSKKVFYDSIGYYFDIPVMQDYFIFIVALQALDNDCKNVYYACRDIAEHPRLTMVPWDLDICLGANFSPSVNYPDMIKPERGTEWIAHVPMVDMWNNREYHEAVNERYKELRKTWLNTDSLVNRYRSAIDELENSGAAGREENRWSRDYDLNRHVLDLSEEMDYVENWIRRHMEYIDEHVFIPMPEFLPGDVNGDGEVNIADVNTLIDIILGGTADDGTMQRADVNGDGEINIADVNATMDIILG